MHGKRVGQSRQAGIEDPPRRAQRLVGLEHHGELDEIEAADPNQGTGALGRGHMTRVGECVTDLAQRDELEHGRQVERRFGSRTHAALWLVGHSGVSQFLFVILIT